MKPSLRLLLGTLALVASGALHLQAASTDTWVGGSGSSFSPSGNWTYSSGSGPVASGDNLLFTGVGNTTPNNDENNFTYNNIWFTGTTAYTLGGNSFTLGSGGAITNGGAVTQTINNNIVLTGSGGTITPGVASSAITLGGVISGSANLTKSGNSSSTLTLNGLNTFSGILTFNSGTVVFTTPPNAGGANLGNPSSIVFGGNSTTTLITTPGAGSVTISYPTITANASSTALFKNGGAGNTVYEISAKITGAGHCKQNSPTSAGATVRFSNDNNDYTGNFSMAAGVVEFTSVANGGSPSALGAASTPYTNGNGNSAGTFRYIGAGNSTTTRPINCTGTGGALTLDSSGSGSVQFLATGNLHVGAGGALPLTLRGTSAGANTLAQALTDVGGVTSLTKSDGGTWIVSGANNYSGGTTINGGTLQVSGSGTLGAAAGALSLSGATLDLGGTSQSVGAVTLSGTSWLTNGTLTGPSFAATPTSGNTASVLANLAGTTAAVSHTGAGTLALLGNNTYGGGTFVTGGGVLAYNSIAPASSACALGLSSVLDVKNGTYQYFGPSATNSRTFQFSTLSGTPAWNLDNAGTNTLLVLTADFVGGTNGGGAGARTIGLNVGCSNTVGTLQMVGAIPDVSSTNATTVVAGNAAGYSVFNGGTVALLGTANTFSGGVQVKYGRTLQALTLADAGTACSLGLGTTPPAGTAPIIIGSTDSQRGGTLAYVGTNDASCNRQLCVEGVNFGGQSGATILNNSPSNSSLHLSCTLPVLYYSGVAISNCLFTLGGTSAGVNTFDMPITNTPLGSAALTVSGSTWQLTAAHAYSGNTTVSGGTLLINGSIDGAGVTNSGGILGGTGVITSPVIIQSGGTLRPGLGLGSIGTLTINNSLSLAGKTVMQINRANAQRASLVAGLSSLTYGGTLIVTNIGDPLQAGDTFTLFTAASYVPSSFSATNLPALGDGFAWDLSKLTVDGSISVQSVALTPPTVGGPQILGDGTFQLTFSGPSGQTYKVLTSTNVATRLASWTVLTNGTFGVNPVSFIDQDATNYPARFYRVTSP